MVLLLAIGNGRRAAPFFFLSRGVTTVAMVVFLPVAVAHAEFAFCDFVRVSGEGIVLVGPFLKSLLQLASGGSRFRMVEASSSSFSRSNFQRERERGEPQQLAEREREKERRNGQRGEGEKGFASFVP